MATLFQQMTVLEVKTDPHPNKTKAVEVQLREFCNSAISCSRQIVVKTDQPKIVKASKFTSHNHYSGRPSILKVFVNGTDSGKYLLPDDFVSYAKILFNLEANGVGQFRLGTIEGVPSLASDTVARFGSGSGLEEGQIRLAYAFVVGYHRNLSTRPYQAFTYSGDHGMVTPYLATPTGQFPRTR